MGGEPFAQRSGKENIATAVFDQRRKPTRRHKFLRTMNRIMPWQNLVRLVKPYYPKEARRGRPTRPLLWKLKLYFLQIWFNLSDPQTEELMHDSHAVQEFLGLDLRKDMPPDETTLCRFRRLLEQHQLDKRILEIVHRHWERAGLRVQNGVMVDARIIQVPRRKKQKRKSPPEKGSPKKGK